MTTRKNIKVLENTIRNIVSELKRMVLERN